MERPISRLTFLKQGKLYVGRQLCGTYRCAIFDDLTPRASFETRTSRSKATRTISIKMGKGKRSDMGLYREDNIAWDVQPSLQEL